MAIIPLRQYIREIEGLIDTEQLDEAVAHCRHVLETFPKHIATYRLLGKAYMEQQRYGDAADIFQRVLSSVPDDHVANIGLSIIREDEGNLDAAIWYMERALEAQPSNSAIKDELRRLYGRRDGIEPPKVRLTRGALARMYARGGLYDQAIAELRAALADDPQRPDLMVLLAQMHYNLGQQVEAVDTCGTIMKQLPYCLVANRILASILPQTGRADDTRTYHQRAVAMDPYFSSAPAQALSTDTVPESTINLERLEYRPGQTTGGPAQPAWAASLGIAFDEDQPDQLPEWLQDQGDLEEISKTEARSISAEPFSWETPEDDLTAMDQPSKVEDIIPDWMKEAGWQPATGEAAEDQALSKADFPSEQHKDEIAKAEIPDWLKDLAPSGALDEEPPLDQGEMELPWLQKTTPGASDTIVNWLGAQKQASELEEAADSAIEPPHEPQDKAAQPGPAAKGENGALPDWLQGVEASYGKSGITDWLKSSHLEEYEAASALQKSPPEEPGLTIEEILESPEEIDVSALPDEELPDWLKEMGEVSPKPPLPELSSEEATLPAGELPDWLKDMDEEKPQSILTEPTPEEGTQFPEELPDWLIEMGDGEPEATLAEPPTKEVALPSEDLPDWLAEMGVGAPEATIVEPSTEEVALPSEDLPDWLAEMGDGAPEATLAEPPTEEVALPSEDLPDWLTEMGDGAPEATIVEPPADEAALPSEDLLDWLAEMGDGAPEAIIAEPSTEEVALPSEDLPDWLAEMGDGAPEATIVEPPAEEAALPSEDHPDWLAEMGISEPEATIVEPSTEEVALPGEDLPDWLAEMGDGAPEAIIAEPSTEEAALPGEDLPDWLAEMGDDKPEATLAEPSTEDAALPSEDLPDWLQEFGQPETIPVQESSIKPEIEAEPSTDEIPMWLKDTAELAAPAGEVEEGIVSTTQDDASEVALHADETPEWLQELEQPRDAAAGPFDDQSGQDAALAWLETLAARHSPQDDDQSSIPEKPRDKITPWTTEEETALPEEQIPAQPAVIEPAHPIEQLPDWLKEMAETPPELPSEEPSPEPAVPFIDQADQDAALAWLEKLAAQHGAKEEELITKPEERLDTIPDWIKLGAEEAQQAEELPVPPVDKEEPAPPAEELPEWLQEVVESTKEVAPAEPAAQSFAAPLEEADEDAALAWLESLAVQHGAKEEELITTPEERRETMPDWIKQEVEGQEETEEIPTQPVPVVQPDLSQVTIEEAEEHIEELSELYETILESEHEQLVPEEPAPPTEELPDWLTDTSGTGVAHLHSDEQAEIGQLTDWLKETATPEQAITGLEPDHDLEKLPDWLRDADQVISEGADIVPSSELTPAPAWMPEVILPEAELPTAPSPPLKAPSDLEEAPEYSEQGPEPIPDKQPPEPININTAPLSQLENLSGIGFIMGQRIIGYREENGPFTEIDDLMNVSGIGPVVIDNLRERLTTGIPIQIEEEIPAVETEEWLFGKAHQAVENGDVTLASELFNKLITQSTDLEPVIGAVQDALYRFPLDINLWQTLGDAYLRTDKLQEALDAYTKAEELLR